MENLSFKTTEFEKFESIFQNSTSLEQIVEAISRMVKELVIKLEKRKLNQSSILDNSLNTSCTKVSKKNYDNLEKVL